MSVMIVSCLLTSTTYRESDCLNVVNLFNGTFVNLIEEFFYVDETKNFAFDLNTQSFLLYEAML